MSRFFKSAAFPILIVVVLAFFASKLISTSSSGGPPRTYQTLVSKEIPAGEIKSVEIKNKGSVLEVTRKGSGNTKFETGFVPQAVPELIKQLNTAGVNYNIESDKSSLILSLLTYVLPFLIFFGIWIFLLNQVQGGGSKVMSFGKSRAKRLSADSPKITFRDVAGVDEAVEELHEIKEFLENPKKFQALGARIPTGVLLYGPPGTGKTLLARAVAGEAGVPFFSISGSDFVEMFVGVGASRVRDLFEQAKQNSPCIIFMDEIDAVGRHRGAGLGGGHDEREQTLNQLLVEMDGFEAKDNIIMIAATNRPDILDPALLRPGRFDRQIAVDRPDRKGRAKILEVHTRGKPLAKEIDIDALAGQTTGFTGADLSNLINEAALLSARTGKREIGQVELEEGIMRVIAGPEKKTRVMSEKERLITAYHEMGHAIVGHYLEHSDPVHKISVVSRGQALGYTISMPQEDRFLTTRAELNDTMAMTLGGRAAEEIVFDEITTGASNDIEKVTATAKQMVMRFGMSEKLGPRVFGHDHGQPFLGREFSTEPDYSDEIAREIDDEVRRIVEVAHKRARDILTEHRQRLTTISEILVKRETIEKEEFIALLAGKSDAEVFGPDEGHGAPQLPTPPPAPVDRPGREAPRPLPRPGLAGGTADIRGTDPERPELA
jgi:cell division protease FtsH